MRIQPIDNENAFKAKRVPMVLQQKINLLRTYMDADAVIIQTQEKVQTVRLRSLDVKGEVKIKDGRFLAQKDKEGHMVPYGSDKTMIEYGKVKFISDSAGNIVFHKKPLTLRWANVFENLGQYIQTAIDKYKDNKIVIKNFNKEEPITSNGKELLTKGYQKVMDVFNELNPFK